MFDEVLNNIADYLFLQDRNVFLTGSAGSGKSYIINQLSRYCNKNKISHVILASTGLAAKNIGGQTIHSFFKFAIASNILELSAIDKGKKLSDLVEILQKLDLIIIDEISMISGDLLEMISYRLKQAKSKAKLLLVGDFYQLPPVNNKKDDTLFSNTYAFESPLWQEFEFINFMLEYSKRTNNEYFFNILSQIRLGVVSNEISDFLSSLLISHEPKDRLILYGTNIQVDTLNQRTLNQLVAEEKKYYPSLEVFNEKVKHEAIQKWIKNLNVPNELVLKVGARVMFVINGINYFNGEQGVIIELKENSIKVLKENGNEIEVERFKFDFINFIKGSDGVETDIIATYEHFPLKLAYAITIHKSQGMSLENFVLDLNNIFAKGQLYVGLSRAISVDGLSILYSKNINFNQELRKVITPNDVVNEFYTKNNFIRITS